MTYIASISCCVCVFYQTILKGRSDVAARILQRENKMSQAEELIAANFTGFKLVKKVSGDRIRDERKRRNVKQADLADGIGVSLRWLREIEAGNPAARLDDHLMATIRLGLPVSNILFPVLFISQHMPVPRMLLHTDLEGVERACIDLVAQSAIKMMTDELKPDWWDAP